MNELSRRFIIVAAPARVLLSAMLLLGPPLSSPVTAQERANPPHTVDLGRQIRDLVLPAAEARTFSGVILVARGREVLFTEGFGYADWESGMPNTPATRFGIGSLTKAMTLVIATALAEEGRLDFEAPVERYIPGFPRGPEGGAPTIDQLLNHRGGVPHRVTEPIDEGQALRAADIVDRVLERGLLFEPGSQRLYSSAGYSCLARVIEIVEGKPFGEVIEERVFRPASMSSAANETGRYLMSARAEPYRLGLDAQRRELEVVKAPHKDLRFLDGAGSVYATAMDLLRFIQAVHDGAFGPLWERWYDADATTWAGAIGRTNGYEAFLDVVPAEELILVVLTNLQSTVSTQVRLGVRDLLRGDAVPPIPSPPPVGPPVGRPEVLAGVYDGDGPPIVIAADDGHLYRGENEFYPVAGGWYYIPGSGMRMRFRTDESGQAYELISARGDDESVARRVP